MIVDRAQGLPATWAFATLGEVTTKPQYGWTTKATGAGNNLKLLRTSDISTGRVNWKTVPTCVNEPDDPSKFFLNAGDIVVARAGSVGKSFLIREDVTDAVFASYLVRFTPKILPEYVNFFMQSRRYWEQIEDKSSGIAIPNVNASKLSQVEIPVAPLNEQRRIVDKIESLFAQLDHGEAGLRDVQKLLARYRQSVLKAAITCQLTADWRAENADRLESDCDLHNPKWQPVSLEELLVDIRYGTAKKCHPNADGIAVLRIPNVVSGKIDLNDLKFAELESKEAKKLSLKSGDMLIVRSNGSANLVGRSAVVTSEAAGLAFAGYLIRLRVNQDKILPEFLHLVMNSPLLRRKIEREARSTSGVHNINSSEIKAISFKLPPIEVQRLIVEYAEEQMSKVSQLEAWCQAELTRSAALRQSILKDAFAGKLVPQDPDDEPASELLSRIRAERDAAAPKKRTRKKVTA